MKILIYSFVYPPEIGGVQNVLQNLGKYLSNKNEVKVITSYNPNTIQTSSLWQKIKNYVKVSRKRKGTGIEVVECFMSVPRTLVGFFLFPYRYIFGVLQAIDEINKFEPDIINYHFPNDNIYQFYLIQKVTKAKTILNIHGNEIHKFSKNPLYKTVLDIVIKNSSVVIVNSNFMKNEVAKVYPSSKNKITIIKNGVPTFVQDTNNNFAYTKNSYYLYVGRLDYKKNLEFLIKTFNKFSEKTAKNLLIIGEGTGKYTKNNLEKLSNTNKIKFLGKVPHHKINGYFKNAYFSIFPSLFEPFGIVALESINVNTPVIVASGSGLQEIVDETKAGLVFENNNEESLLNTLHKVDNNTSLRNTLANAAKQNINKYYWEHIAHEYDALFKEVTA